MRIIEAHIGRMYSPERDEEIPYDLNLVFFRKFRVNLVWRDFDDNIAAGITFRWIVQGVHRNILSLDVYPHFHLSSEITLWVRLMYKALINYKEIRAIAAELESIEKNMDSLCDDPIASESGCLGDLLSDYHRRLHKLDARLDNIMR